MNKLAWLLVAVVLSVNCGKGGDNPTGPSSSTPQPVTMTGTVNSFGITQHSVTIQRSGNMTLSLTWGTTADLDLYLTMPSCTGYPPSSCSILAASDAAGGASERVTRTVTAGETFKAWVDNFASSPQNYTLTMTIQ